MSTEKSAARPIPYRSTKIARDRALCIIKEVREALRGKYRFNARLVGSGHSRTMCDYGDGTYDLDYQLILTHNSKSIKTGAGPKRIKDDFKDAFDKVRKGSESFQNSTTAITLVNGNDGSKKYSIDFVILFQDRGGVKIIRRNGKDQYTWNELPHLDETYRKFNSLSNMDKQIVRQNIIDRKYKERNDPKKSSLDIFVQEVNNFDQGSHY